ncbi:MAG: ABC transporter ATP-binding protein [Pseudomonadota bacterium]
MSEPASLEVRDLSLNAGAAALVRGASFRLGSGAFVALLGPNGAGKTSLIRGALGLIKPSAGWARIDGREAATLSPAQRARRVAYLPQRRPLAWPNRVRDVVALGRFAHGAALGRLGAADAAAVDRAIAACGLADLAERRTDTLSGGELARVHSARVFASGAPLLIADEPTAALDPRRQFEILDLIRSFTAQGGGALVALHDVPLAARYATRMIWMKEGRILADGPPEETVTAERLRAVYGVRALVEEGRITFLGAA